VLDNDPTLAADAGTFERAVSQAAGICVELARRGFNVALAVRGGHVPPRTGADIGSAHVARILRVLALIAPQAGRLPGPLGGVVVRVRPGAAPALEGDATSRRSA
jgi:uncharacterized protein (DUF58 family)